MKVDLPPVVTTAGARRAAIRLVHMDLARYKSTRLARARSVVMFQLAHRPSLPWVLRKGDRYARRMGTVERLVLALIGA